MFQRSREVPAEWQADLERLAPRSATLNWLKLYWHPGIEYEPVQRWVVYEMVANSEHVPDEVMASLKDRNPREDGLWVGDPSIPEHLGGKRWLSNSLVSLEQWQLFRQTGCYGLPVWIVQGERGGHKWKLSLAEQNMMASLGHEGAQTPAPGSLPYADYDQRTYQALAEMDRLCRWREQKAWTDRARTKTEAGLYVVHDRWLEEQAAAQRMLDWLEAQIEDAVSDIPRTMLPAFSDLPEGDRHFNEKEDELERELVEFTGSAPRTHLRED